MRTPLLSALLALCCTLPAAAGEKAKPNTLTPQEIADGWILLFDGETTFGWAARPIAGKGNLRVADGALDLGDLGECSLWSSTAFGPCEVRFEYQSNSDDADVGMEGPKRDHRSSQVLPIKRTWTASTMTVAKDRLRFIIPDVKSSPVGWFGPGNVLFAQGPDTALKLRNIKLRPTGPASLFNGKDLTGWKVFPGKKSQVTVDDGAIRLKDGPGDLQSDGKYANFILQLECKSNGKHLNSGVFFRCKPNEYQNGYEAQIHNNFTADPPKEYTVEEYDPETHKPLDKKKVKSAAVDYGTGAIYRRVPARKEVAKDGEWFTMTVVALGNHIATWVNGVQQVDWYDNRPPSDNPRTGCRLEAGHISLQGHDATTDLSFRNIRIAELP
jgi:hypothetical protein